ncbi:UNVERIFIED_CONTAM: hypothetical protein NCL1_33065 [Trichonephila clavipes]
MIRFGVFVTFVSLAITSYVSGQFNPPETCGSLTEGYNTYYQCILRCYQRNFRINMVRGDFCSSTVQMRGSNKVNYSSRDVANSLQCITKQCRFVGPPLACTAPIPPITSLEPDDSISSPDSSDSSMTTAKPDYDSTPFPDTTAVQTSANIPSSFGTTQDNSLATTESTPTTESIFSSETAVVTSLSPEISSTMSDIDSVMALESNDFSEMSVDETPDSETEECDDESDTQSTSSFDTSSNDDGDQGPLNIFSIFNKKSSSKKSKTPRTKVPKNPRNDKQEASTLSSTTECEEDKDEDNSDDVSAISGGEKESSTYSMTPFLGHSSVDSSSFNFPSEGSSSLNPTTTDFDSSSFNSLYTTEESISSPQNTASVASATSINNEDDDILTTSSSANMQNKAQSKIAMDASKNKRNSAISESEAVASGGNSAESDYSDSEYYYDSDYYYDDDEYYDYNDTSDGNSTSNENDKASTLQLSSITSSQATTFPTEIIPTASSQDNFLTTTSMPTDFTTVTDAFETTEQNYSEDGGPNESEDDSDIYDKVGPDASMSYALAESDSNPGQTSPLAAPAPDLNSDNFNRQQLRALGITQGFNNNPRSINNRNNAQGNTRLLPQSSFRSQVPQPNTSRRGPLPGLNQPLAPQRVPNQNTQAFQSSVAGNRNSVRWPNNLGINRNNAQMFAGNGNNGGFGVTSNNGNFNRFPLIPNQNEGNYGNRPLIRGNGANNYVPQRTYGQNFQNNFNSRNRFSDYYNE